MSPRLVPASPASEIGTACQKPGLTHFADALHRLQRVQTVGNLGRPRFLSEHDVPAATLQLAQRSSGQTELDIPNFRPLTANYLQV